MANWYPTGSVDNVWLKCKKCLQQLAAKDILVIGTVPPSQTHLAVRPGEEEKVLEHVVKVPNHEADEKKAAMLPFKLLCTKCETSVGRVSAIEHQLVWCFKVEAVRVSCVTRYGQNQSIEGKKLKQIREKLKNIGIPEYNLPKREYSNRASNSVPCKSSKPLVYCNASSLNRNTIAQLTRDDPRDYQQELFLSAIRGNSLVYLPTGSGKTLIAAMVISCMKYLNPDKLAVFVVNRVHLAHQQRTYLKDQLPGLKVKSLSGDMALNEEHKQEMDAVLDAVARKQVDVLVLTHQIFLNNLVDEGVLRMVEICALIIDEAHHCLGEHQYNCIMRDFYFPTPDKNKPLLLALTASPGGDLSYEKTLKRVNDLLSRLKASPCMSVNSPDLVTYTNRPDTDFRVIPLTPRQQELQTAINAYLQAAAPLLDLIVGCPAELSRFLPTIPNFQGTLRGIIGRCHDDGNVKGHALGELMTHLLAARELNNVMGLKYSAESLNECLKLIENSATPMEREKKKIVWADYHFICLRETVCRMQASSALEPKTDKFQHLVQELNQFVNRTQKDPSSRGIIFVQMRRTAYKLCERLKSIQSLAESLKPMPIVGHGNEKDGMEWDGQQDALKKFRSGRTKLVVSTSVLEEGLDVPACNLIIRFDRAMTLQSLVQGRGRASRRSDSKFVVLCSDDKEQKDAMELKVKERNMDEAMRFLYTTSGRFRMSQAFSYACPLEDLDSSRNRTHFEKRAERDAVMEQRDNLRPITKVASVTFEVHNMQRTTESNTGEDVKVIEFFNGNFNVTSLEALEYKKEKWSLADTESLSASDPPDVRSLKFELHQVHGEETPSSCSFADAVIEKWCSRFSNDSQAWLERVDVPRERAKVPVDLVAAESVKFGYFRRHTDFCNHWPEAGGVTMENVRLFFQHDVKMVIVLFTVQEAGEVILHEMEIRYSELENFIVVDQKASWRNAKVFLALKNPARFHTADPVEVEEILPDPGTFWVSSVRKEEDYDCGDDSVGEDDDFADVSGDEIDVDLPVDNFDDLGDQEDVKGENEAEQQDEAEEEEDSDEEENGEVEGKLETDESSSNMPSHPLLGVLDIGEWSRVSEIADSGDTLGKATVLLLDVKPSCLHAWQTVFKSLQRWGKRVFYAPVSVITRPLPSNVYLPPSLTKEVTYVVQCLLATHPTLPGRTDVHFGISLTAIPQHVALAALDRLNKILDSDYFCQPAPTLDKILGLPNLKSSRSDLPIPGHCALVRRLILTPTRLLFRTAEIMQKNRVLRKYDPSNFLCVNIRDEDFSSVTSSSSNLKPISSLVQQIAETEETRRRRLKQILTHLKTIMDEGVEVCGERYVFLGCSNSQLRSHSCWFVKSILSPDVIRQWMGDFAHIRCVATYVSRMGQCFSTSMDTVGITVDEGATFSETVDINTENGDYTFSDGVGGISKDLAFEVTKKIKRTFAPSAFQIRFAGCKGVLAVDSTLTGKQMYYRPSMRKFESPHRRLEVIQTSRPQAVYLNHQVIMLLSNLGIPDEVFISLMRNALDHLAGTLLDERMAIRQLGSAARNGIAYRDLSSAGINLTVEPFFRSLVAAVYRDRLLGLLHKARIQLPIREARLMMGVVDETGVLQYGQVFVQYSAASTDPRSPDEFDLSDKRVLTGSVVVTRNPCLHPGDVRRLVAVDTPLLRHLVDCVVFPQKGPRPHPSEMAGGDLDGDLYFVCWHKSLIPPEDKPLHEPMDYRAPPKLETNFDIISDDMTTFLMNYICSDQLGKIDNAHKALADQLEKGVEHKKCIKLAEAHSFAVDAPKTGQWPVVKVDVKAYPDFMMKPDKPNYRSQKVLGKIYRACRAFKRSAEESAPMEPERPNVDKAFLVSGYEIFVEDAKGLYREYCEQIDRIMTVYGITSEAEVLSGCFRKLYKRLSRERTEVAEIVSKIVFELREKFRKYFFEPFGMDGTRRCKQKVEVLQQKASAWYMEAYTADRKQHHRRCFSFPWLVDDVMASIRSSSRQQVLSLNLTLESVTFPLSKATIAALPKRNSHPRVLDLTASLMSYLQEDTPMLFQEFKRRVNWLNQISLSLRHEGNFHLVFFGSTATFLFREDSDVDVCVIKRDRSAADPMTKLSKKQQATILRRILPAVRRLFRFTRLVSAARVPIIYCRNFKHPSPQGTITVPIDLSTSREGLVKASLVTSYLKSFPGLLPVLRFLLRWGHVSGLTGHRGHVGVNSNALTFMFLSFCFEKGYIVELSEAVVIDACHRMIKEGPGRDFTQWENIICNLVRSPTAIEEGPTVTLNGHIPGEVLISFLSSHSSIHNLPIPPTIASFIAKGSTQELVDSRRLGLLSEHMQRAYHALALRGDLKTFLILCGTEIRQAIHLTTGVSCMMRGAERQSAREMERKTGARVTIRPKVRSTAYSLIVEARGTEFEVEAVEQLLQEITSPSGMSRLLMMSVCFVQGSSQMLFEDSLSDNDPVKLEPYKSNHHPQHDGTRLYTPMLATLAFYNSVTPPTISHSYLSYQEKFLTQFQVSEREFDTSVHGNMEFIVHFGRVYIFRVPKSFIEDAENVTIEMLQANLKKGYSKALGSSPPTRETRSNEPRVPILLTSEVQTSSKGRKKKTSKKPTLGKKKKLTEKPTKSSFFTVVASGDKVEDFLRQQGFLEVGGFEEYGANVCADAQDIFIKFDDSFNFKELSFPNLRWCLSDVKRRWKENKSATTSRTCDGIESDVRFMLQSRRALGANEIQETEYEKYLDAILPNESRKVAKREERSKKKNFMVKDEVWGDVNLIRHKTTREFRHESLYLPNQNPSLSNLLVQLSEVHEYSRPMPTAPSCFRKNFRRFEVSIKADLPKDWADAASIQSFLANVWNFSFGLSSYLSEGVRSDRPATFRSVSMQS